MSYPLLLTAWLLCYIGPVMAGPWYDYNFTLYQSSISLFLILCALPFRHFWWIRSFCTIALLQIALNVADYFSNVPPDAYNATQTVLNAIEFMLLFVVGCIAQRRDYAGNSFDTNRGNNGRG